MRTIVLWDWFDFGIAFKIYINAKHAEHYISIYIQIAWFNLWIQIFKQKEL